MAETIPVVIFHLGSQPYFMKCVELNAKYNKVIVIGDQGNLQLFQHNPNVTYIDVQNVISDDCREFEKYFVNYSTNSARFEMVAFQGTFILREYMKQYKLNRVILVDSDCILLDDMTKYFNTFPDIKCAMSVVNSAEPFSMTGCVHNSLLTLEFCDVFVQLCKDIYQNKSKFHLIQDKINWHQSTGAPGGICVMTINYIIVKNNMVTVADLNEPRIYQNEMCTFDHNIGNTYGHLGDNTYIMNGGCKILRQRGPHYYAFLNNQQPIRLLSMHFQGGNKRILESLNVDTFYS